MLTNPTERRLKRIATLQNKAFRKCSLERLEDRRLLTTYFGTGGSIPDPGTMTATIDVPDSLSVDDVNVTLTIDHTRDQDLDVFLISPLGTRVELFTDVGGNGDDFLGTTLDSDAATSIGTAEAPFSGTYRPEGSLAVLHGENALGTWTLELTDDRKREAGNLQSWSLEITGGQPAVSISDVQLSEGDSGTTAFVFQVTRSGDTTQVSSVDFATVAGTATEEVDYAGQNGTLQFEEGASVGTIAVDVYGDTNIEPSETFAVQLSNATNAVIVDGLANGLIEDDDANPSIDFTPDFSDPTNLTVVNDAYVTADSVLRLTDATGGLAGAAWYDIQQYASVDFTTNFQYQMSEGTSDGFAFVIQNYSSTALYGGGGALGYRFANSLAVEFDTFQNSSAGDPNNNHISVQTMGMETNTWYHSASLGSVTPSFDLNDGLPHTVQIDYVPGTLSIYLDHEPTAALTVPVNLAEVLDLEHGQAWFGFTAATGGGWQNHDILNWQYTTLSDTSPQVEIGDAETIEGDAGQVVLNLPVTLRRSGDTSEPLSVDVSYQTTDGTATAADADFEPIALGNITLSLAAGETEVTQYVSVYVNGDESVEPHEMFYVDLISSPVTIVQSRGRVSILNDDTTISVNDVTVTEGQHVPQFIGHFVSGQGDQLDFPSGLEIVSGGDVYVSSVYTDNVLRYDGVTGELVGEFVAAGDGGLQYPGGLNFGTDGKFYVCSQGTDQILRYDADGTFLDVFVGDDPATEDVDESGGLDWANEMTFSLDGDLYVSSRSTNSVLRYDSDGNFVEVFVGDDPATVDEDETGGLSGPEGLVFGDDGNLYVASSATHTILRYDGSTGDALGPFVPAQTGGLSWPHGLAFEAGELYVTSAASDAVLRYDSDGQFIDEFAPALSGGLDNPRDLAFGDDGNLYVNSGGTNEILVYGDQPAAVFTVSLASATEKEVRVDFDTQLSTVGDTAEAGTDYVATSGTVIFPAGATSRVIAVPTVDDTEVEMIESFAIELYNASEATISDPSGTGTIRDDDALATETKFYVVDANSDQTFEYNSDGEVLADSAWSLANSTPEGATANPQGTLIWVIDRNGTVHIYGPDGEVMGSWEVEGLKSPKGIATDGLDIWILEGRTKDPLHKAVLVFEGGALWTSGSHAPTSSWELPSVNENPTGITTDGTYVWITDNDSRNEDNIWMYDRDGGPLLDGWDLPPANTATSGVTIDPTGASHNIWVVDSGADAIFEYAGAYGDESLTLVATYPLAAGNTNPQGIADPLALMFESIPETPPSDNSLALRNRMIAVLASPPVSPCQDAPRPQARTLAATSPAPAAPVPQPPFAFDLGACLHRDNWQEQVERLFDSLSAREEIGDLLPAQHDDAWWWTKSI
jgi:subtilisin-like proprotein convertase family protein